MRKISLTFLIIALFVGNMFASTQKWVGFGNASPSKPVVTLVSGTDNQSVIKFTVNGFFTENVATPKGEAVLISVPGAAATLEKGSPQLPYVTTSLMIPDKANMVVKVLSSEYTDYENILVAPSKGDLKRDVTPSSIPYTYGDQYQKDEFFPATQALMQEPFIFRDVRGQVLTIQPFVYNAATKTLRVYHEMTVEVKADGVNYTNAKVAGATERVDAEFMNMYKDLFINYNNNFAKYEPIVEYGKMLVISHAQFIDAMAPFVEWKNSIGYETELVNLNEVGTTATQIQQYLKTYYETNNNAFVLFVGDSQHIPPMVGSYGHSDIKYAYITGNDRYPEFLVGRFSVETVAHVETMVNRTIEYEKNPNTDTDWFSKGVGIASQEGPGDNGEYDYQHMRNIRTKLMDFTYTAVSELYEGSQGGVDAPGWPTAAMVSNDVNSGVTIMNYCGHGSTTSWGTTGFSNTHINQLTNNHKWPFIWSVACVNGEFVGKTCFAEAWTRASNANGPTGALATLMATINQAWNQPMHAQDEMVDVLTESYENNIKRTFAGLSNSGVMKMLEKYPTGLGPETAETWVVFGDPSVMVRTAMPAQLQATHPDVIFIGLDQPFVVNTTVNGARATLSRDGELLATGVVENGEVALDFDPVTSPDPITLTVTGFNHIPYITEITPSPAEGAYLVMPTEGGVTLDGDGILAYNENTGLSLKLKNIGQDATSGNVTVKIVTTNPKVTINTATITTTSPVGVDQTVTVSGFSLTTSKDVENDEVIEFTFTASDNAKTTWEGKFSLVAKKPVIEYTSHNWEGSFAANSEQEITVNFKNNGGFAISNASVALTTTTPNVTITNVSNSLGNMAVDGIASAKFKIEFGDVAVDQPIPFKATVTGDAGAYTSESEFNLANECDLTFKLKDGYTDGWNGAALTVSFNDGSAPVTMTVEQGQTAFEQVLTVGSGTEVTLTWKKGSYDAECSFIITDSYGNVIYEHKQGNGSALINGVIYTFINNCMPTGINDVVGGVTGLRVYPNPATEVLNVQAENIKDVVMYNSLGQAVKVGMVNNQINVSTLSNGVYYLVVVSNDSKRSVEKIVIAK